MGEGKRFFVKVTRESLPKVRDSAQHVVCLDVAVIDMLVSSPHEWGCF